MLTKIVLKGSKPYLVSIVFIIVLQISQTIATLYLPTINADLINQGIVKGDTDYIWNKGGLMLLVSAFQVICAIVATYFSARVAMGIGRDLRSQMFSHIETLSSKETSEFGAPTLITRTTNDVKQVQELMLNFFLYMVSAPIMCVGAIILAIQQDEQLSLVIWVLIPIVIIAMAIAMKYLIAKFKIMQKYVDSLNNILREQIIGVSVIRAFVKEKVESKRFGKINTELTQTNKDVGRAFAFMHPFFSFVLNVASVAVIWFGASQIQDGSMEIGSLTAFLVYIIQVMMAIGMGMFMIMLVPRASVGAYRIGEVLNTQTTVTETPGAKEMTTTSGRLSFKDLSYRYPGAEDEVLKNISFTANPGEVTAIIGSTGSGKTTLINLIPRLIDPTAGELFLDALNLKDISLGSLRSHIALVPQKAFLFKGTISSNLKVAKADVTEEEMWQALEIAQAADFVRSLDNQLEAEVDTNGKNFSGGQKQRLCIARGIIAGTKINLFDDSFSALDYTTDAKLREGLEPFKKESTMIIVAQRVSSIRNAEKIIVLNAGKVVGEGTHTQLLKTCQEYQEIVQSQLSAEEVV